MAKKLDCILLVDDSPSTNFYNKRLIHDANMANKVVDLESGLEAMDYLTHKGKFIDKKAYPKPNIIFLDINMPKMDGFEFMEHYKKLSKENKKDILVVFLTAENK